MQYSIYREVNHTHFPRSFITKSQYQFNPHNISYYNNEFDELDTIELTQYLSNTQNELISLPCVHEDFLESYNDAKSMFLDEIKKQPDNINMDVLDLYPFRLNSNSSKDEDY